MNKIIRTILTLFLIMIIIVYTFSNSEEQNETFNLNGKENIQCLYFDPLNFIDIKQFDLYTHGAVIRGSILPHHLLASDLIHQVFQNIKIHSYETVVLIGPDHESILMGKVFTTLKDWQTPFGVLHTDSNIISELLKNDFIIEDEDKLTIEHSISSIVPFVKYYIGDVKIVPLAMTKQTKLSDIKKLVSDLSNSVDIDKTLFVSSVDFSHYLNIDGANQMDLISMEAIKKRDINKIMSFTNDNLDSPVSIVTMLILMEELYKADMQLLNHSNSELITKQKMEETTSYITYLFFDS